MADADVNIDGLRETPQQVKSGCDLLEDATSTLGSSFTGLKNNDPDLISNYVSVLTEALTATRDFAMKAGTALQAYVDGLEPEDTEEEQPQPDPATPPGDVNPDPVNPGPGGPVSPPPPGDPGTPADPPAPEEPIETPLEPMDIDTSCLRDLPLKDVDGIVDTIIDIADKNKLGIDEVLADDKYNDQIKEALLKSDFIPDELKEQLLDADSVIVRKLFESIMKGEFPEIFELNPLNIGAAYKYLQRCASELGISVEELLTNDKYTEVLKEKLKSFDGVVDFCKVIDDLPPEKYQDKLLGVWDGNDIEGMEDSTVDVIRDYISYVAEQVSEGGDEIAPEELLTNRDYAEVVKEATQQFAKSSVFFNSGAHMSDKGCHETIGGVFTGKNAKAMGMDKATQEKFIAEVDAAAKAKGTTTEAYLSDNQYADDVKDMLLNSSNAPEVGAIYKKEESLVSQHVVKNLYENKITNDSSVYSFVPDTTNVPTGEDTNG
jgi:hypothetical protein